MVITLVENLDEPHPLFTERDPQWFHDGATFRPLNAKAREQILGG